MQTIRNDAATAAPAPRRRWWRLIVLGAVLLAAYAVALAWVTRRLEADVQHDLHPLPAVQQAAHADD